MNNGHLRLSHRRHRALRHHLSRKYSSEWRPGDEPYYPVNDEKNTALYAEYKNLATAETKVIFGGRLAEYKYYDMDQVVAEAARRFSSAD